MAYAANSSYIIPAAVGVARFNVLSPALKALLLFCLYSCFEVGMELVMSLRHMNNTFLSNLDLPFELIFIGGVYWLGVENRKLRMVIVLLVSTFLCVWAVDQMFFYVPGQLNNEMGFVLQGFFVVLSVLAIHSIAKSTTISLVDEPIFWISTANILYATGALLIFGLMKELIKMGPVYFSTAWHINWSLVIIWNLMFAKGLLCKRVPQTSSGS